MAYKYAVRVIAEGPSKGHIIRPGRSSKPDCERFLREHNEHGIYELVWQEVTPWKREPSRYNKPRRK